MKLTREFIRLVDKRPAGGTVIVVSGGAPEPPPAPEIGPSLVVEDPSVSIVDQVVMDNPYPGGYGVHDVSEGSFSEEVVVQDA